MKNIFKAIPMFKDKEILVEKQTLEGGMNIKEFDKKGLERLKIMFPTIYKCNFNEDGSFKTFAKRH